jgi:uncharacterized protein YcaQ
LISLAVKRDVAKKLMLVKQGVGEFPSDPKKNDVFETVKKLGCIQIDTINVIERAHYITLWSRLGNYKKEYLNELAYKDRKLFEYEGHAVSYLPFQDYRYFIHSMKIRKKEIPLKYQKYGKRLLNANKLDNYVKPDIEILDFVLKRIKNEGPLSSKDFEGSKRKGGWWNWKPAKLALELLYGAGVLMVSRRENFHRYYDLAENVIPDSIDITEPTKEERIRFFTIKTLECLGLCKAQEIRKYYHNYSIKLNQTSKQLEKVLDELVQEDVANKYKMEGDKKNYYCKTEDSPLLEQLTEDSHNFGDVRFFVYFDNFMWIRERIEFFFGFKSKLEIYLPKQQRSYGYYHLPILYGDKIVGRIEPKMDRAKETLIIRGLWYEKEFIQSDEYNEKFYSILDKFAEFNGAKEINWSLEK